MPMIWPFVSGSYSVASSNKEPIPIFRKLGNTLKTVTSGYYALLMTDNVIAILKSHNRQIDHGPEPPKRVARLPLVPLKIL